MHPDFGAVIQYMPGASAVIGAAPEFTVLAATDDYLRVSGATRALIGQPLLSTWQADTEVLAALRRSLEAAWASGGAQTLVAPPWKMTARAVPGADGRTTALVHHLELASVPAHHATPLLADMAALEPMFGAAPIGIAILQGREHRIVYANAVELGLWGRTADQVLGRPAAEALPELAEQGLLQALCDPVLETGEPVLMTEQPMQFNRHGEGLTTGYFNAVHLPIRDQAGTVTGLMAIAWEITEAVLARQRVEELSRELNSRMDLEQHLIGIVSHDLRNPLSVILLSAQVLLARPGLSAPQTELVDRIVRVTNLSIGLIRDLMDFTQARLGGRIPLQRRHLPLRAVLEPILDQMDVEHPDRIVSDVPAELAGAWDPARVGQAVQNLLTNAVQYSEEGTPVRMTAGQEGQEVWLAVHNAGTPIPPELHATIFEPMRRSDATRNSATRNLGMGLYIAEQIARAHGGRVTVTSAADAGTRFTLWLPVSAAPSGSSNSIDSTDTNAGNKPVR